MGEVEKAFGVLVISLRKQYKTLSNTLSFRGRSDLERREVAQAFGVIVDGRWDFCVGSNFTYSTILSRGGPGRSP